jgi:hypothetical protein
MEKALGKTGLKTTLQTLMQWVQKLQSNAGGGVILAEAEYQRIHSELDPGIYIDEIDPVVHILDGNGNRTEETLHIDYIIDPYAMKDFKQPSDEYWDTWGYFRPEPE